ncbi:DUF1648 domain-containing protein [Kineococcus sp. SYSU DK006]|uniref:DUF1648 domain-containing protein n=1 Tax=Kineococcus sp. SYSU DK006 TaxID=3383127 RepID=UPI003D7CE5C3
MNRSRTPGHERAGGGRREHRGTAPPPARLVPLLTPLLCLAAVLAAAALVLSWREQLPEQLVVHWGPDGPDGYARPWVAVGLPTAIATALTLPALRVVTRASDPAVRRAAAGSASAVSTLIAAVLLLGIGAQRDLSGGAAPGPERALLVGLPLAALAYLLAHVLAGRTSGRAAVSGAAAGPLTTPGPVDPALPRLPLSASQSAVWTRRTSMRPLLPLIAAALTALAVATTHWLLLVPAAVVLGAHLAVGSWRISVDARGLTARSLLGRPRVHVPADQVLAARATTVSALREFGGWGLRHDLRGRTGIVPRSGEALQVDLPGDRQLVVTVSGAATAAALLTTVADRAR